MSDHATILIVDDDENHARATEEVLSRPGHRCLIATSGQDGLDKIAGEPVDVVVTDLVMDEVTGMDVLKAARQRVPPAEVILITGHATVKNAVEAMQQGACSYIEKPFDIAELRAVVDLAWQTAALRRRNEELEQQLDERYGFSGIIGQSPKMTRIFDQLRLVASTAANVLITGESGTGKELIAKAIHNNSPRRNYTFAPINCAAISENLLESELFGHERGSFTGASATRKGRFEYAHMGTLFLDEVGSMPLSAQAKLLRALEEREVTRVGSNEPIPVDVRIIAASIRDLQELVDEGSFRGDLCFRLKVVAVNLPPLRERKEDIPLLIDSFARELSRTHGKQVKEVSPDVRSLLCKYDWPGNVRELRNWIESMVVVSRDEVLDMDDLPDYVERPSAPPAAAAPTLPPAGVSLAQAEESLIESTLASVGGNREEAAKVLGIGERTLYRKIDRYGLK